MEGQTHTVHPEWGSCHHHQVLRDGRLEGRAHVSSHVGKPSPQIAVRKQRSRLQFRPTQLLRPGRPNCILPLWFPGPAWGTVSLLCPPHRLHPGPWWEACDTGDQPWRSPPAVGNPEHTLEAPRRGLQGTGGERFPGENWKWSWGASNPTTQIHTQVHLDCSSGPG